ncbi:MAG: adenosine kinase, partial [Deltaproteobacteria bacterium]
MPFDVYGVGNSLVDIQARISDEVVARLGFHKGVMTLVDETTQRRVLSALDGVPLSRCAGGSAANTVIAVADFGGQAAYAGKAGADALGHFFLDDMRKIGVTIDCPAGDGDSGTCVILITPDAQRTMLTHLGVSATLGPEDISEADIRNSTYVYVEGYLFAGEPTRAAALRTMELAKRSGVKVAFTVSDPFLI